MIFLFKFKKFLPGVILMYFLLKLPVIYSLPQRVKSNLKILLFLSFCFMLEEAKAQSYVATAVVADKNFFNGVIKENRLYFGTSEGIFSYNEQLETLELFNESITTQINDKLEAGKGLLQVSSIDFNSLLPAYYQNTQVQAILYKSNLFLISLGTLFVYTESIYNFTPYYSIRTISNNYIGSYGGIFYKGNKLEFPKSTDGKIKEFKNNTFICYGGLSFIRDGNQVNFQSETNYEFTVKGKSYGFVRDIEEIDDSNYILFSTSGIYLFNVGSQEVQLIEKSSTQTPFFVNNERLGNKLVAIYYYNEQKLVKYAISEKKTEIIHKFDTQINCITTISDFQIILALDNEHRLFSYKIDLNSKKLKEKPVLGGDYKSIKAHSLASLGGFLFVVGDAGVDVVDLSTNKRHPNIISQEMNRFAQFSSGDTLFLGGVNGLYTIQTGNLKSKLTNLESKNSKNSIDTPALDSMLILSIAGVFFILIVFFLIKNLIENRKKLPQPKTGSKDAIDLFIREHLNTVSIETLSTHFNLTVNEIYKVMGNNKPGEYIRKLRIEKVKALRAEQKTLEEISAITGFSVSYLKKI